MVRTSRAKTDSEASEASSAAKTSNATAQETSDATPMNPDEGGNSPMEVDKGMEGVARARSDG